MAAFAFFSRRRHPVGANLAPYAAGLAALLLPLVAEAGHPGHVSMPKPPAMHFSPPKMPQMHYSPPKAPQMRVMTPHFTPSRASAPHFSAPHAPRLNAIHASGAKQPQVHHAAIKAPHPAALQTRTPAESQLASSAVGSSVLPSGGIVGGRVTLPRTGLGYGYGRRSYGRRYYGFGYPRRFYPVRNRVNVAMLRLRKLIADLDALTPRSQPSQIQRNMLRLDLMAVSEITPRPSSATVQSLADHLASALPRRTTPMLDTADLAGDLKAVMNTPRLGAMQVQQAIAESQQLLKLSGVPRAEIDTITTDLRGIAALPPGGLQAAVPH